MPALHLAALVIGTLILAVPVAFFDLGRYLQT
jgi:hypothetical protein